MTVTDTEPAIDWDPYDTALDDSPYAVWRRMRDEAPVYRNDRYDFWALSRFHDVELAHRDPSAFSSSRGTVLESMGPNMAETGMMIFLDPPNHTQLRSLVSWAFTPRSVAALEDQARTICSELLDPHIGSGGFDYVQDFAAQVPSWVISALVGVPAEDQEELRQLVEGMFHIEPGVGMANKSSMEAALKLIAYLAQLIEDRRRHPRDDMASALCNAEIPDDDGSQRRLTDDEATRFALLLYTAGTETVAKLLGNAAVVLADHPDQRRDVAEHPDVIANAVEELLRFEAPSPVNGRWTTRAVELHGVEIPPDAKVLLLNGSAGRDERVFVDPDRFDVRRTIQHHVSFGYGIHFCVGAALARLEGRVAIEETLKRFPTWDVDNAGLQRAHTSTVRGFRNVPLVIT